MLQKRILKFKNYSDVITEIESLRKNGYTQSGKWNLGQICRHLSYYQKGALDGFPKMMPWIIRVTIGKLLLKKMLTQTSYKEGMQTDPKSVFPTEPDDTAAIEAELTILKRLESNTLPLHPSAFFGEMTNEQQKILHLGHSEHHLGFLHPIKK